MMIAMGGQGSPFILMSFYSQSRGFMGTFYQILVYKSCTCVSQAITLSREGKLRYSSGGDCLKTKFLLLIALLHGYGPSNSDFFFFWDLLSQFNCLLECHICHKNQK